MITHGIGSIQSQVSDSRSNPWYLKWSERLSNVQGIRIADAITKNEAIALTDGSYQKHGTAWFCIGENFNSIWQGACRVPGPMGSQSAYHSELISIYATLQMCRRVCTEHSIQSGGITIACDNLTAGHSLLRTLYYPNPTWDHFDVLQAIFRLIHILPIRVWYIHVEGHQRTKYPS